MPDTLGAGGMSDTDLMALANQMGGISAVPEQNSALEKQIAMANMLREGPVQQQGTHISPGSVYVGPNALQSIGSGVDQGMAMGMQSKINKALMQNANNQQGARTAYMKMIADHLRGTQPQMPGQPMQGAPGGVDQSGFGYEQP
jgi:hypothetical protein